MMNNILSIKFIAYLNLLLLGTIPLCAAELFNAEPTPAAHEGKKYFIQLPTTIIPIPYSVVMACAILKQIADAATDETSDNVTFPITNSDITEDSLKFVIKYIKDAYNTDNALTILERRLKSLETAFLKKNIDINQKIRAYLAILKTLNYLDVQLAIVLKFLVMLMRNLLNPNFQQKL